VPHTECNQVQLSFHPDFDVEVRADAPTTSSDGGLLLLRQADEGLGLSQWFAHCLNDDRDAKRVRHGRLEQVRQRLYQIAMGYEDCNDSDGLRHDPMFKTACDLCPEGDEDGLSSQPTLSRFENAVSGRTLNQLRQRLEESYVQGLPADRQMVVLDIDSTDDETHGQQQLTFFHGFYDQHMYHPLLVFDGESGELVSVLLRPGNAHAARSAKSLLCGIIRRIKARFPNAQILVRADAGFCVPRLLEALEELQDELGDVEYVIGIAKNPRLLAMAETTMAEARRRYDETRRHVRHFSACRYSAETWSHERHVIIKAEHGSMGANPRFVVTTLDEFDPRLVYDVGYCARGRCENFIKDFKNALAGDRLSCGRYIANFFRLLLHAAAYRLLHALRTAAAFVAPELSRVQFDTLRLRLLKVAAFVTQSVRRILVRLPRSFPFAAAFRALAGQLARAAPA
jgi:Transposase DDE domain group 1